jgi:hypothetical protein
MKRSIGIRLFLLVIACAALMTAYHQATTEDRMAETAARFLHSLNSTEKAKVLYDFSVEHRRQWHFVPDNSFKSAYGFGRTGITYKAMSPEQRRLANALLSSGLSGTGLVKAMSIMSLEERLRVIENDTAGRRDVQKYYVTMYGKPTASGNWGWRVEGHHISLHYTLKNGRLVSASPTFFGANPHRIEGGFRALPKEEDLARSLVKSLDAAQRKTAVVADVAYKDILTRADTRAKLEDQPRGLAYSKMTPKQREMLMAVIAEYAHNVPASVAEARMKAAKSTPQDKLLFAWAGGIEPGKGDYYRVQAPGFLIEYDNTQNNNNHSHTVWRDFEGDFGLDVLADVLAMHHRLHDPGIEPAIAAD